MTFLFISETGVVLDNFMFCSHISHRSWQQYSWVISCRAANVFSCAYLVNLVRPAHQQIPSKYQKALWYSGKETINASHWLYLVKFDYSAIERTCFFSLAFSLLWCLSFATWTGLRGAMAFALALQSVHDLPEGHGQTIFTATTAIVVLTVETLSLSFN